MKRRKSQEQQNSKRQKRLQPFEYLPYELFNLIISFVSDKTKMRLIISRVSKSLMETIKHPNIWKDLCIEYNNLLNDDQFIAFMERYLSMDTLESVVLKHCYKLSKISLKRLSKYCRRVKKLEIFLGKIYEGMFIHSGVEKIIKACSSTIERFASNIYVHEIVYCSKLVYLELYKWSTDDIMEVLNNMKNLKSLTMIEVSLDKKSFTKIGKLPNLESLTVKTVGNTPIPENYLQCLTHLKLKKFRSCRCYVDPILNECSSTLEEVSILPFKEISLNKEMPKLKKLKWIHATNIEFDTDRLIQNCPNLEELGIRIHRVSGPIEQNVQNICKKLIKLTSFHITESQIRGERSKLLKFSRQTFEAIASIPKIKRLTLDTFIDEEIASILSNLQLKSLIVVYPLSQQVMKILFSKKLSSRLEELQCHLSGTVNEIPDCISFPSLRRLAIRAEKIKMEDLVSKFIQRCPNITELLLLNYKLDVIKIVPNFPKTLKCLSISKDYIVQKLSLTLAKYNAKCVLYSGVTDMIWTKVGKSV